MNKLDGLANSSDSATSDDSGNSNDIIKKNCNNLYMVYTK